MKVNREVIRARMHVSTNVYGLGNLGPVIDHKLKSIGKCVMTKVDGGVLLAGTGLKDEPVCEFLPDALFINISLAPFTKDEKDN